MKLLIVFIALTCLLSGNNLIAQRFGFTKIGSLEWMSKDLDVVTFRNGDSIAYVEHRNWGKAADSALPAWTWVDSLHPEYGRVYNKHAVNDPRELAPAGWRIANRSDWLALDSIYKDSARTMLSLDSGYFSGSNKSRFNAIPGGYIYDCAALNQGFAVQWWTRELGIVALYATADQLYIGRSPAWGMDPSFAGGGKNGFYIRCIKTSKGS